MATGYLEFKPRWAVISSTRRWLFLLLGHFFVLLGVIGAFLPVMPTTPFALLAAYFYSKSSPKFHLWLLNMKLLGPLIRDWEAHGVIRPKAKLMCTLMLIPVVGSTVVLAPVVWQIKAFVVLLTIGVLIFVLSRPSSPPPS